MGRYAVYVYPTEMKANFKGYTEITPYQLFESTKKLVYTLTLLYLLTLAQSMMLASFLEMGGCSAMMTMALPGLGLGLRLRLDLGLGSG